MVEQDRLVEPTTEPVAPPEKTAVWETLTLIPLLLILILAGYLRFSGLNWDANYHLHPDERFLTIVGSALDGAPDPITYLRTSESPLNPYNVGQTFFVYGNFPMTVTVYAGEWANRLCTTLTGSDGVPPGWCTHNFTAYDGIQIFGRALSGLIDLVAIVFVFLMGRRLYDWRVGLLAALLHATAVMHIQQAHFFTMDNWAAALTTLTLYTAVRAAGIGDKKAEWRYRWWLLFGVGLGLAVASRINVAPLAAIINLSAIIWLARRGHSWQLIKADLQSTLRRQPVVRRSASGHLPSADLQRVIVGVTLAAIVFLVTFRLAQPYAFADSAIMRQTAVAETGQEPGFLTTLLGSAIGFNPQWQANMEEVQNVQGPDYAAPFALQWTDRTPILFPLTNMILYGLGIGTGIFAWVGFLWALWRIVKGRPDWTSHLIPVTWAGAYFLFMGTRWVLSTRYFLPIYSALILLAAWALVTLWDRARAAQSLRPLRQAVAALLIVGVATYSFLWAKTFITNYTQPFTRIAASEWIIENIPTAATLFYETNAGEQQQQLPVQRFTFATNSSALQLNFTLPEAGAVTAVRLNYATQIEPGTAVFDIAYNSGEDTITLSQSADLSNQESTITIDLPDTVVPGRTPQNIAITQTSGTAVNIRASVLMNEAWDDPLPVGIGNRNMFGDYYLSTAGGTRPVTDLDTPQKRESLISWLEESDVIILSSQRAMWSLPRLPISYPMMIEYYASLFNGDLGFDLVSQFHADYHIGPLYISDTAGTVGWGAPPAVGWPPPGDLAAEEAFSIYDHPPVWIFVKSDDFNREQVVQTLGNIDLSNVVFMTPGEATRVKSGLRLSEAELAVQRRNGTFSTVFNLDSPLSTNSTLAAVVWWLVALALGWLAFPLTAVVLRGFPDKGYTFSRIVALLLVSYFGWLMASLKLLPNSGSTYWLGVGLLALLSGVVLLRNGRSLLAFGRRQWRLIGAIELLALLLYGIAIAIRLRNPDLWDVIWGGEKPMDLTYFTAVLKSTTFPPYDPWFAGGYINYYYYGFVFVGSLTKLLGIIPALAYNLSLSLLFSLTGLGAFGVAFNLVAWRASREAGTTAVASLKRPLAAGAIAATLAVIVGNLAQVGVMIDAWYRTGTAVLHSGFAPLDTAVRTIDGAIRVLSGQPAAIYPGDWFWTATRTISAAPGEAGPITEFPFFTFLYGDLHAHMISLPLTMLALAWAVALVLSAAQSDKPRWWEQMLLWGVGAIALGSLQATNIWDLPTYAVIGVMAVAYAAYLGNGRSWSSTAIGQAAVQSIVLVGLALLAFQPFSANFGAGFTSVGFWQGSRTPLGEYLSIHGLFLFLAASYILLEFRAWTRTWTAPMLQAWENGGTLLLITLGLYVLILFMLLALGFWVIPLALTLTIAAGLLGLRQTLPTARRVVLMLIASALGLTIFVEFFVVEGTVDRMNTVFKVYMQVWMLLSVVGGVTAVWLWAAIRKTETTRRVWQTVLAVLVVGALLYPLQATAAKWNIRMSKDAPTTLNGMEFMPYVRYDDQNGPVTLNYDYDALLWMQRNIAGSPVIAEAYVGNYYRSIGNRVAMFTGLPAIIGWAGHQNQQRAAVPGNKVDSRIADVSLLYNSTAANDKLAVIDKYDVSYIYVGQLEWLYYSPEGLNSFDQMVADGLLEEVYRNQGTSIYRVIAPAALVSEK